MRLALTQKGSDLETRNFICIHWEVEKKRKKKEIREKNYTILTYKEIKLDLELV